MPPNKLLKLSAKLCRYAPLLANGLDSSRDEAALYSAVEQLMDLPPEQEAKVLAHTYETLQAVGGGFAWDWLQDTLEAESTLAVWELPQHRLVEAVLFAVPVVFSIGATPRLAGRDPAFDRLTDILQDSQALNPDCRVALCNRLLSLEDLGGRTPGELMRLTAEFCEQMLDDNAKSLQLPRDWAPLPPDGETGYEGVQLFFLLGVASAPDASALFAADAVAPSASVGMLEEGVPWESAFSRVFCNAFEIETLPVAVFPPEGVFDAMRTGSAGARGVALSVALELGRVHGLLQPLGAIEPRFEAAGTPGIQLEFTCRQNKGVLLRHYWPFAYDETPDECLELLGEQLRAHHIEVAPLFAGSCSAAPPSLRLH